MAANKTFRISGHVVERKTRQGVAGLRVETWDKDLIVDDLVGSGITDALGFFHIEFDRSYFKELFLDRQPDLFFKVFRDATFLQSTGDSVYWNVTAGETEIVIEVDMPTSKEPAGPWQIKGQIHFDNGLPAGKIVVRLYHKDFGGVDTRLDQGKNRTDAQGSYELAYEPSSRPVNLQVRIVNAQSEEIPLSATKFDAGRHEVLNLVAPSAGVQPLAAEYRRLTADLARYIGGLEKLADAREDAERQDLTLLHKATGWDARLIALAALAVKQSAETGLSQEVLYALFRTGLPNDARQLAAVSVEAVGKALVKATETGIVSLDAAQISAAKITFEAYARPVRKAQIAPGALSSLDELLDKSELSEAERNVFAELYFTHRNAGAELWQQVQAQGIADDKITKLRLQGKLACLTLNNAALTESLQSEIGSPDNLAKLVGTGTDFYKADAWVTRINTLVDNRLTETEKLTALEKLIPPAYAGEKTVDRLNAYAADLARKVRLSFPTQVIGRMIEQDELRLGEDHGALKAPVQSFLQKATELGFELGRTPIDAFIRNHQAQLFDRGLPTEDIKATTEGVRLLQRLYQITPRNESLQALFAQKFTSAYEVAALPYDVFLERFCSSFPSREEAQLVYRKAQQVSNVTFSFFTAAKHLDSAAPMYAVSGSADRVKEAKDKLIEHYPTMESLFGSLDFCECEHCRSVLSPAAYFVDLLEFINPDETHNGPKPYDVLIERRPDLPHLPLTCENTNTVLPYIDVVNEILEYCVANNDLAADAVHDTGAATTPELLAEPQNVISEAYDNLKKARYPLTLPFDLWLETVRRFFRHSEIPLWQILEIFRRSDNLSLPVTSDNRPIYSQEAVFAEYLGISPDEYAIFGDQNPLPKWYELYGYKSDAEALTVATDTRTGQRTDLNSAKALSRRLGVGYKELVDLVRTGFVNPRLDTLVVLRKLELDADDVFRYKKDPRYQAFTAEEQTAFEQRLDDLTRKFNPSLDRAGFDAKAWLDAAWKNDSFNQVLVLADPNTGCNFDQTILRLANGDPAGAFVFLKINLFVRLWKKLGWTMEETDRALQAFVPKKALPLNDDNLGKAMQTALLYLVHLKALSEKVDVSKISRLKLFALWSDLDTTGKNPLYAQLFLTQRVLKDDPVFDHPLGKYLCYSDPGTHQFLPFKWNPAQPESVIRGNVGLKKHQVAVQAALNLTADEIDQILADAGKKSDSESLTLANISLLYRYGLLAKAMEISVRDFIVLKNLSGLKPFKLIDIPPASGVEQKHPWGQTLRFVEVAEQIRESGLTLEDLDYLLRHRFDETGKYRPNREGTLVFLKTLADGVRGIRIDHAVPDDPGALSDETLRQELGLALPPDVVDRFLSMINGTAQFTATRAVANQLYPSNFIGEPAVSQLTYNIATQEQKLVFRGVLFDEQKAALMARFSALTAGEQLAFAELLDAVQAEARQQADEFFVKHLKKQSLNSSVNTGFLEQAGDFNLLCAPLPEINENLTEVEKKAAREANEIQRKKKLGILANAFFPFLQQRLIRQFILQTMAAYTSADPVLVESLLTDERLLKADSKSLLASFEATGLRGISATFFDSPDLSGAAQATTPVVQSADTVLKDTHDALNNHLLNPAGSARFEGYMEVPTPGTYRFYVTLEKQDAEAELRFPDLPKPLVFNGKAAQNTDELGIGAKEFVAELKSGVPYRFTLELKELNVGAARLLVQGETLPKGPISQLPLYPLTTTTSAEHAVVLLSKVLLLVQSLGLSEREIRYLLTDGAGAFDNLDFDLLPWRDAQRALDAIAADKMAANNALSKDEAMVHAREDNADLASEADQVSQHFKQFLRLAGYARLKRDLAAGSDDLIDIFETNDLNEVYELIAKMTRREGKIVEATAMALFHPPSFKNELTLQRLWEALQVVERLGVPVDAVVQWATPAPDFAIARDLKNTVKARYESENWQRIAQSIFDPLRQAQRDALVAYVLHNHKEPFENVNQLFEYFLIDPGMEPVVQTSRLRLAISSVQLFIQRCLLNLEHQVSPSAIYSPHWKWMKRYRVWEANRKIFLYPENWLEPEFRDDKTDLFEELEGALLQGDVSNDLAEDAFFNYLKKLEQLARLEIVTMYCEEKPLDPDSNTLHVIGRTFSLPHKYYYRRYAHQMWTPWDPVTTEIEGNHVVAVIWRERLHLFWVTFLEKPGQVPDDQLSFTGDSLAQFASKISKAAPQKQVEVQLNWSEYFQGHWTTRESGGFGDPIRVDVANDFDSRSVFIHVSKEDEDGEERAVKVHLSGKGFNNWRPIPFGNVDGWKFINETAYRVVSKNSPPEIVDRDEPQGPPYAYPTGGAQATRYQASGKLQVSLENLIGPESGKTPKDILSNGDTFSLLTSSNPVLFPTPALAPLVSPFFYQDNLHTLFVEPALTEPTIDKTEGYGTYPWAADPLWVEDTWWKDLMIGTSGPDVGPPPEPDPLSRFPLVGTSDWVTDRSTLLQFGSGLIGQGGGVDVSVMTPGGKVGQQNGADFSNGSLATSGFTLARGINMVSGSGLNSVLLRNLTATRQSDPKGH